MEVEDAQNALIYRAGESDTPVATVSNVIVNPVNNGVFLPTDYKSAVAEAIAEKQTAFEYLNADGESEKHTIVMRGNNYIIYTEQQTTLIDMYALPSLAHPLGTDDHGMDVMTRLMYGGRISLMVGFVVMILENLLGIVVGGVSGYFGGWVDTLLMRFVDLFNSIPYYPIMIITGSIMDAFEINPYTRIFLLMAIMGVMGWTGVARVVRGQILSLREQDFMIATEATGIRVSRRIFRHLVPNVMPLLIVQATMGLGSIILTEATLSFLGLGIKYPLASWGSIINAASNIYVMTNFWFIWIPAGILIVLTVLGFNFVGDGLRDAFDPKMKR
ncbi:MAG: ABC transporter permease [Clostridia bacterium]|nr:ABC transporter permease [Clostridia bacterium]MBQ8973681.1 ABC transporter permease [Clostridia bacterium]